MASCVRCLNDKQFKDIITIKKDVNKKVFQTLFKDADEAQLTICKTCFGEFAEFLDEDDFIDEIPASWMQDDCDTVKEENCDIEQEIIRYDIVALEPVINHEKALSSRTYEKKQKNMHRTRKLHKNIWAISKTKKKKQLEQNKQLTKPTELRKDIPTFVLSDDSNSFDAKKASINQTSDTQQTNVAENADTPPTKSLCFESFSDDNARNATFEEANNLDYEAVIANNLLCFDSKLHENNFQNQSSKTTPINIGLPTDILLCDSQQNEAVATGSILCMETPNDSNSLSCDENTQAKDLNLSLQNVNENSNLKADIPIYEIDDESVDSSVHFVDEVRFEPPQNIAEDSLDSIDLKDNIETFETQTDVSMTNNCEASEMSAIGNEQESCSINQQMRILEEFEKQCEVLEQRLTDDQDINEDSQNSAIEEPDRSKCHTINFDAVSGEQEAFICSGCGQVSDKIWKIEEHIAFGDLQSGCKNVRIEIENLKQVICCEYCGLLFRRPIDLQAHRAIGIHSDLLFKCPECFNSFKDYKELNAHSETHVTSKTKFNSMFMCNVGKCVKTCLDWSLLLEHKERFHVAQICPICREIFHDGRFFTTHVKDCKDNALKCKHCVKTFHPSSSGTSITHEKNCLSWKEEKIFRCTECDATFKASTKLRFHIAYRHEPIDCSFCGKIFKSRNALRVHFFRAHNIDEQKKQIKKIKTYILNIFYYF